MFVIKDSNQGLAWGIDGSADKVNAPAVIRCHSGLVTALFSVLVVCLLFTWSPALASFTIPTKSIAQLKVDDDGRAVDYPLSVFYDPVQEEIYLINGGKGRVVVYGPDFFPRMSIGVGRGVLSPRGGAVMSNGEVYICQIHTSKNPSTRLTILNGAFFVDREIFLEQIPAAENFTPRQVAVSRDSIIYLAGDNYRGVLVLDNEGNFLRRLQPMDNIILRTSEEVERLSALEEMQEEEKQLEIMQAGEGQELSGEAEETAPPEDLFANIPEEFRPRSAQERALAGPQETFGPVKVNSVNIDSTGNLYLISAETGKIYVYGPDESFLFAFGTKGGSPGQLSNPRDLTIDEKREVIYVVDYMRHTVLAYDMTGNFIFELGGRGFGPGWFNFPTALTINSQGQLIVADLFNKRVQVLEVSSEDISYFKEAMTAPSSSESSGALESPEQEEVAPGQPEGEGGQEGVNAPESSSDQQTPEASESQEQEEVAPGQPEGEGEQEGVNAPESTPKQQTPEASESQEQEEVAPGQPEGEGEQEGVNAPESTPDQQTPEASESPDQEEVAPGQPEGEDEQKDVNAPESLSSQPDQGDHSEGEVPKASE